ncbi:MAG TPA: acetyl-CoA carboxylase biotin carboxylase subunit [Planctomycetota bacterium]|nr:acetyl-CoA carboxylase biotin carboxylase subunit [Planctomycetota bacterium]
MFRRLLIANRGEIALRILRACRELGIETVVVYSEADRDAAYLRLANETICVGPSVARRSYLDVPSIISAAEIADVEAIHPGYGFLAENAHFAEVCRSCNIRFVGPSPEAIAAVGNKVRAKEIARAVGAPVIPGSEGKVESEEEALAIARGIGYPVILKAAAGGGGRGMRIAHNDFSLVNGFHAARSEAEAAFRDPSLYLEKYVERPRHVEIQILADERGTIVHLGERDCTLQRRHQKLVEEAPSPAVDPELRARMGAAAIAIAKAAKYSNAGTIEFLVDGEGDFYFMEVNARIQVEHPVTEAVTGLDLVQLQIRIAAGEPLGFRQGDVSIRGHAIEARVNAEDPLQNFAPSPGRIQHFIPPGGPGVRLDTHVHAGAEIPSQYDSLVAKLIVHRADRRTAIATMRRALDEFVVEGIRTTLPLHQRLFAHPDFMRAEIDTGFVERLLGTEGPRGS